MTRFFFDEAGELEEYQSFRRHDQYMDLAYEKIRVARRAAAMALKEAPGGHLPGGQGCETHGQTGGLGTASSMAHLGIPCGIPALGAAPWLSRSGVTLRHSPAWDGKPEC
jgi:hypothetical protein